MLSVNLKIALVILLMQNSCSSFDFMLAKRLLIEATEVFSGQEDECDSAAGTAIFINQVEKISC